jgi:hypothetical protein
MNTTLCPICDAVLRPDPQRPGALWCDSCQEPTAFESPEIETIMSMSVELIADSAALTGRVALLALGLHGAIATMEAIRDGELVIGPDGRPIE